MATTMRRIERLELAVHDEIRRLERREQRVYQALLAEAQRAATAADAVAVPGVMGATEEVT